MTSQTIRHLIPAGTQGAPVSDTSIDIREQVRDWQASGALLHPRIAMVIAAGWQMPSNAFAPFASTGTITDDLAEDIADALQKVSERPIGEPYVTGDLGTAGENTADLHALLAYVMAARVTVWTVGHNIAGYMQEDPSSVSVHLSYADAAQAFIDLVSEAADDIVGNDVECQCDDNELCEWCLLDAHVKVYLTDDGPRVSHGRNFGPERECLFYASTDSRSLPTVYWLSLGEPMAYADYLAETA